LDFCDVSGQSPTLSDYDEKARIAEEVYDIHSSNAE
jgi:lipoate synthase